MQDGMITIYGHLNISSQFSSADNLLAYYILHVFSHKEVFGPSELEYFLHEDKMAKLYRLTGLIGPFTTVDEIKAFTQDVMDAKKIEWSRIVSTDQYNDFALTHNRIENFKDEIGNVGSLLQRSELGSEKKGIFSIFR